MKEEPDPKLCSVVYEGGFLYRYYEDGTKIREEPVRIVWDEEKAQYKPAAFPSKREPNPNYRVANDGEIVGGGFDKRGRYKVRYEGGNYVRYYACGLRFIEGPVRVVFDEKELERKLADSRRHYVKLSDEFEQIIGCLKEARDALRQFQCYDIDFYNRTCPGLIEAIDTHFGASKG